MKNIELEKEIEAIILKSPVKTDLNHAKSTRKWILKLRPDAKDSLEIAALAHDIERGFEPNYNERSKGKFENYAEHKRIYSEKSAKIIVKLLDKYRFDEEFVSKVKRLILNHEIGGDLESDLLMDADSISFFEENFVQYYEVYGEEKTKKKIRFMYNRMSKDAQEMVKNIDFDNFELKRILKE